VSTPSGPSRLVLAVAIGAGIVLLACVLLAWRLATRTTNQEDLLRSATACAAPATCSVKIEALSRQLTVCTSTQPRASRTYANGDVVLVSEKDGHVTVGRVTEVVDSAYMIQLPDGFTRHPADHLLGRVCH
jgi:hypothetical protein